MGISAIRFFGGGLWEQLWQFAGEDLIRISLSKAFCFSLAYSMLWHTKERPFVEKQNYLGKMPDDWNWAPANLKLFLGIFLWDS